MVYQELVAVPSAAAVPDIVVVAAAASFQVVVETVALAVNLAAVENSAYLVVVEIVAPV